MTKLYLVMAAMLTLMSCARVQAPVADTHDADVKAIQAIEQGGQKAWAAKDVDGIVAQYASDAEFMATGVPVTKGVQGIRVAMAEFLKDPALSIQFASSATEVSGDLGYQRGDYTMTMTDAKTKKPAVDKGSFVTIFKKQTDGSWKVVKDINVSGPSPQ